MSTPVAVRRGPRRGITASGAVVVGPGRDGRPRLVSLRTTAPLGVKLAGGEVHLMGTAGGPLGGDDLRLDVRVLAGTTVTVRGVAATLALPGDGRPSRQRFAVTVEDGATLRWRPEPLVAAAGCDHHVRADVHLHGAAELTWSDQIVLGRSGEAPGRVTSTLRVSRGGRPLVHHGLSTHQPGWAGPAVTAGARVIGSTLHVGPLAATLRPATGPSHCTVALAPDVVLVTGLGRDRLPVVPGLGG